MSNSSFSRCLCRFVLLLSLVSCSGELVSGFYLPGVAPHDYNDDDPVEVKVIKLDSVKTQLPYKFYSLPFCSPHEIIEETENLGEILSGDRIQNSLYDVHVKKSEQCKVVCAPTYSKEKLEQFAEKIEDEYRVHWSVDSMPAATKYFTSVVQTAAEQQAGTKPEPQFVAHYEKGFPLGFVGHAELTGSKPGVKYINNHLSLIIQYNEDKSIYAGARIVGFEVEARSIKHKYTGEVPYKPGASVISSCNLMQKHDYQPVSHLERDEEIIWTYDVLWERSDNRWATRWEIYTKMTDAKIHWFSIINSIMIVLFLSGMVAVIFLRILNRDFQRYNNEPQTEEEQKEETGWKLIHGDVFRPPANGEWLAVLVGTGVQVFAMTLVTLVVAALGFLSPANRGGLMTALLFLFVFMGFLAGYYSTRVFKMFGLTNWKRNAITTGLFFPGLIFGVFFILNLFVWSQASSGAVPFITLTSMLLLWLCISAPLAYFGAFVAFRAPVADPPCKVNNLCRLLPPDSQSAWYTSPQLSILLGGILPFAAVFIEIFFIMSSVWLNQFYLVFGFLFIVFIILLITCAEITIVLCYFQLCNEDYHWWWRSYLTPGSSALYLFLYSILYFSTKLQIVKFVSALLFFGYMLLVSAFFFVLTGTIGYVACYAFVHKIYSSIKVD